MRFSIITVSLNSGDDLKNTIKSILSQNFDDYEVIIKDGLSTDDSIESVRKLVEEEKDTHVRMIVKKDDGIYDGMNQALVEARGDYVCFLNSGDLFFDTHVLEKVDGRLREIIDREIENTAVFQADTKENIPAVSQADTKENIPAAFQADTKENSAEMPDIIYGDIFERVTCTVVRSNPKIDDFACYRNVPCHQACFYKRELIAQHPFEMKYRVRADYEQFLWCRFVKRAVMYYLPEIITSYEGGGLSDSDEGRRISKAEHDEITKMYIPTRERICYKTAMIISLAPLRTAIARNPRTAMVYNKIKGFFYRR